MNPSAKHYKVHKPSPIDLVLQYDLNFIEGSIIKYIMRSPFKGDRIGDLKKALYYAKLLGTDDYSFGFADLDEYIELIEEEKQVINLTIWTVYDTDDNWNRVYKNIGKHNKVSRLIQKVIAIREKDEMARS